MSVLGGQPYLSEELSLEWGKCAGGQWCLLRSLNLQHAAFEGLHGAYVIWHGGSDPRVVYVGQGAIAERLRAHRTSPDILRYAPQGLFVTWSPVEHGQIDGVESFLVRALSPLENKAVPSAPPVSVNFPW